MTKKDNLIANTILISDAAIAAIGLGLCMLQGINQTLSFYIFAFGGSCIGIYLLLMLVSGVQGSTIWYETRKETLFTINSCVFMLLVLRAFVVWFLPVLNASINNLF